MKRDLTTPDGIVSWDIIRQLYELDQGSVRLCPKLTTKHVSPNAFEKIRVKYATQIFSHSVASAILTALKSGKFSSGQESAIAAFIEKINKLFECLNSHCLYDRNPYKCALQTNNIPYEYLQDMKNYFQELHYPIEVYCIKGMVQTISSILGLAKSVLSENSDIFFIATAKLNQDSLENLFYLIRSRGATNSNPSMYEFNVIMSKMLSMKIITSKTMSGNCELKAPTDYFFILIQMHFNIFQCIFTKKPHISNLNRNLFTACVSVTENSDGYAD